MTQTIFLFKALVMVMAMCLCCRPVAGKAPIPVPEAESQISVAFSESQAKGWFCFSVASDRGCDPAASPCCAERSPTKAFGPRELRLAIDPACSTPAARARLRTFEWAVGSRRVNGRYDAKYGAARAVGAFAPYASLCVTVPASAAGQPCTTPAELCGGTDRACKLQVVTSPFKQYGDASGAKRACIVEAKVAIGPEPAPPVPSPQPPPVPSPEPASPVPSPAPPEPSPSPESPTPSPSPPEPSPSPTPVLPPNCNESSLSGADIVKKFRMGGTDFYWILEFHQSVRQAWVEYGADKQASWGKFFEREHCRWRVENGTDDPGCTGDAYGQRRRRGWVNLRCNRNMMERASLVEVKEQAACDYELYVETPETCNPPPKCGTDGGLLAGATAQGSLSIRGYPREFTVKFNEEVTQAWRENSNTLNKQASLGKFSFFDRERCRWRVENGTDDPGCTPDAYGQRRRRAWVNLWCDETIVDARAKVVLASEPVACEYEVTVASRELC